MTDIPSARTFVWADPTQQTRHDRENHHFFHLFNPFIFIVKMLQHPHSCIITIKTELPEPDIIGTRRPNNWS
jgi:hypothetical protein